MLQEQTLMDIQTGFPVPSHVSIMLQTEEMNVKARNGGKPEEQKRIKFVNPNVDNYANNINYAEKLHKNNGIKTFPPRYLKGRNVIVCGSGPTLKLEETLNRIRELKAEGSLVVACKHAIRFLTDEGIDVDFSVTMDPGAHIARPDIKIYKAPNTKHIVASSSDPILFRYLLSELPYNEWLNTLSEEEQKRVLTNDFDAWKKGDLVFEDMPEQLPADVMIFHSATGLDDEFHIYKNKFEHGDCMGGGYNVVNRAVAVMLYGGVDKIALAGTDCGWRSDQSFYVGGINHVDGVDMCDNGLIDGNPWNTRPDMLASGIALAKLSQQLPSKFEFIGDTLPSKLALRDKAFLDQCGKLIQQ